MKKINLKGVSVQTWARTIVLFIALINQILVLIGKKTGTLDIDTWQEYVSYALTALGSVWAWWQNNSFTHEAQQADKFLNGGSKDEH